jgi:beta-lactam-binding protein with PASTA domain
VVTAAIGARPGVVVPDVRGTDELESLAALRAAGLYPSRRVERRSRSVPQGQVIRTRPRAGAEVPAGTRVTYVIATQPRAVRSPAQHGGRRARGRRLPDDALLSLPGGE